jgi:hypothetical protein
MLGLATVKLQAPQPDELGFAKQVRANGVVCAFLPSICIGVYTCA